MAFSLLFWYQELPDFAGFQALYAMENLSTFASTLSLRHRRNSGAMAEKLRGSSSESQKA